MLDCISDICYLPSYHLTYIIKLSFYIIYLISNMSPKVNIIWHLINLFSGVWWCRRMYSLWGSQGGVGGLEMQQMWTQDDGRGGEHEKNYDNFNNDYDEDEFEYYDAPCHICLQHIPQIPCPPPGEPKWERAGHGDVKSGQSVPFRFWDFSWEAGDVTPPEALPDDNAQEASRPSLLHRPCSAWWWGPGTGKFYIFN